MASRGEGPSKTGSFSPPTKLGSAQDQHVHRTRTHRAGLEYCTLSGCSATEAPTEAPEAPAGTELDENSRGSGSIGGWRSRPGQRTI